MESQNRWIIFFIVLAFILVLVITFVLLGFQYKDELIKLAFSLPNTIKSGGKPL